VSLELKKYLEYWKSNSAFLLSFIQFNYLLFSQLTFPHYSFTKYWWPSVLMFMFVNFYFLRPEKILALDFNRCYLFFHSIDIYFTKKCHWEHAISQIGESVNTNFCYTCTPLFFRSEEVFIKDTNTIQERNIINAIGSRLILNGWIK